MKDKIFLGIDLGLNGGIVAIKNNKVIFKRVMPIIGSELNLRELAKIFNHFKNKDCHACFEKFSGFFGYNKSSAVSISNQSGMIESMVFVFGIPYTKVNPRAWQKVMWENTKLQEKRIKVKTKNEEGIEEISTKLSKDTKKMSLNTIKRLMPKESFLKTPRCSTPHDGLVDAALLALYAYRKGL